jgi:hypothetical protein
VCQLLYLDQTSQTPPDLPQRDLFVKPVTSRGGKGAERRDLVSESFSEILVEINCPASSSQLDSAAALASGPSLSNQG